jgi:hypothetical protein
MRTSHRILVTAAFAVAVSGLIAAPAAAGVDPDGHEWIGSNPDGTRVTSVGPDGDDWIGSNPDGTRVTVEPLIWPPH